MTDQWAECEYCGNEGPADSSGTCPKCSGPRKKAKEKHKNVIVNYSFHGSHLDMQPGDWEKFTERVTEIVVTDLQRYRHRTRSHKPKPRLIKPSTVRA